MQEGQKYVTKPLQESLRGLNMLVSHPRFFLFFYDLITFHIEKNDLLICVSDVTKLDIQMVQWKDNRKTHEQIFIE